MKRILDGLHRFQTEIFPEERDLFARLASSQSPEALFLTCSDSRIVPDLLTQTKPGDLFICRVIGNVVPPYPDAVGGVSATIEYAVGVLGVEDVIVCGHTDCGVMKGVLNPEAVKDLPAVSAWLDYAQPARERAGSDDLVALAEQNVVQQIENLKTHPAVQHRLSKLDLGLHGWMYHLAEGQVTRYDAEAGRFVPARD
jgi:carbonic anhydrase